MRATFYCMTESAMHRLDSFCRTAYVNLNINKADDSDINYDVVINTVESDLAIGSSFKHDIITLTAFDDKGAVCSMCMETSDFARLVII